MLAAQEGPREEKAAGKEVTVAMTFPGGTHDLWIRYWLAAGGIDPDKDVSTIVVPPPQMVANMKVGNMDAFCVGEPWNDNSSTRRSASRRGDHGRAVEPAPGERRWASAPPSSTTTRTRPLRRCSSAVMEASAGPTTWATRRSLPTS